MSDSEVRWRQYPSGAYGACYVSGYRKRWAGHIYGPAPAWFVPLLEACDD